MTLRNYAYWVANGRPWHPALPIAELASQLNALHGEIGTIGDQSHLLANPPEDHTPYSHTGWPIESPYPYVHAIDYSGPRWTEVCDYWISEARAGRMPFAKYINNGRGLQFSHTDGFRNGVHNTDANHVHLSIRSDWTHKSIGTFKAIPGTGDDILTKLPELKNGNVGQQVRNAQALLNAHGSKLVVDGDFGGNTEGAVKAFQTTRHIPVDGVIGEDTWTALLDV